MSQQAGISFKEFRQRFQTEEACEAFLFEQRWPEGFVCPKCGGHTDIENTIVIIPAIDPDLSTCCKFLMKLLAS